MRTKLKTLKGHFRPQKIFKVVYSEDEIGDDVDDPNVIYILIKLSNKKNIITGA